MRGRGPAAATGLALALLLLVVLAAVPSGAAPGLACPAGQTPVQSTVRSRVTGKVVDVTACRQGGSTPAAPPTGSGGAGGEGDQSGDYTECTPWEQAFPGVRLALPRPEGAAPDAEPYMCIYYSGGVPVTAHYLPQWLGPGEASLPSPQQVAGDLLADVQGELHHPDLVSDPAEGSPALLAVPTFVAVGNWQEGFARQGCDPTGAICVELTATPALTFNPRDGTGTIPCEPGGTRFDPEGPSPQVQAGAEGACAHSYGQRTGVAGRPEEWAGEVTVTWSVAWRQTAGGVQAGTLADIPLAAPLPREVHEVQSVLDH